MHISTYQSVNNTYSTGGFLLSRKALPVQSKAVWVGRVFTKVMTVVGQNLRSRQTQIFMYLDNWLIKLKRLYSGPS